MDQELRDLVEQMRQLIPVLQGLNKPPGTAGNQSADNMTRGVDRMVVALGQLVVKLDATKKSRREEEEAVKKFANAVERTARNLDNENKERQAVTDALEKEIKAREEATKEEIRRSRLSQQGREDEDKENAKQAVAKRNRDDKLSIEQNRRSSSTSRELFDSLSSTGGSAEILKNKFLDLGGDSLTAQAGLQVFSAGLSGTAKSLTTFASGLLNGERGAQLSAKAVSDFAKPVLGAAGSVGTLLTVLSFIPGPAGLVARGFKLVGGAALSLVSAFGGAALKFNELGAKQLDTLVKSFNDASGAGVSLAGGLEGTLDLMHTLNMTTADAAQFNELLSKNNKQLTLLGGTAGIGAKRFAEVSGALVKSNLGETFEIMGITQQEQREAALLYMSIQARTGQMQLKNTEQLIEESGKFVEELDRAAQLTGTTRKEQQEAREAALAETRYRAAVISARNRGDKAEMEYLERVGKVATILKNLGDQKGFIGALQGGASRGALQTPEAIAAEQTYRISELLAKPNATTAQMLQHLGEQGKLNQLAYADTNVLVDTISGLQTDIIGIDQVVLRALNADEEARKAGFSGPDAIDKFLDAEGKKRRQPGGDMALMTSAGRAQQAAAQIMEQGIATFNSAADINNAASKTFAKAVEEFGRITGVKPVPGGLPTFGGVPVESGVRLPPTVAAATAKVEQAKTTLKSLEDKIKEQEQKLSQAKTNAEKDQAEAEIKKLKSQLSDATKAKNAADLGKVTVERGTGLSEANQRMKSGLGPPPMDAEAKERFKQQLKSGANAPSPGSGAAPTKPTTSPTKILDLLGRAESGGNYNILVGGKTNADLTNMTIAQVLEYQSGMIKRGHETTAVGKYQIVRGTLNGLLKQGVVSPTDTFSPSTQDKLAVALLNQLGWSKFQNGKISADQMADALAKVWSALPLSSGQSAAQGIGSNKATVGRQEVLSALTDAPKARDGGMFQGPMSGYPAMLHGKEAVIPLENGAVPVMLPALDELVSSNRAVDAQVQVLRNEMGSMMRELVNAIQTMKETGSQERMIQLLEGMSRSQQSTATATQRMAQLASN
jgi:muramidase (phage lysozyme)